MTTRYVNEGLNDKHDLESILNRPGFAQFLAEDVEYTESNNLPDINMADMTQVREKLKTFETVSVIKEKYKEILTSQVQSELGIKLGEEDFGDVDKYFEKISHEKDTSELLRIEGVMSEFKELPEEIKNLESSIAGLGGPSQELSKNREESNNKLKEAELVTATVDWKGFRRFIDNVGVNKSDKYKAESAARESFRKSNPEIELRGETVGGFKNKLANDIADLTNRIDGVEKLESTLKELNQRFADSKLELFSKMKTFETIKNAIKKKINEEISKLSEGKTLSELEAAQERFEKIKKTNEKGDISSGLFEESDIGTDQEIFNGLIGKKVKEEILSATKKLDANSPNAFTALKKSLSDIVQKEKLGSMVDDNLRSFIFHAIGNSIMKLKEEKGKDYKVKAIYLQGIMQLVE